MRLESCRSCGLEMSPDLKCDICHNFVQSHCPKCGTSNYMQVHIHHK